MANIGWFDPPRLLSRFWLASRNRRVRVTRSENLVVVIVPEGASHNVITLCQGPKNPQPEPIPQMLVVDCKYGARHLIRIDEHGCISVEDYPFDYDVEDYEVD